MLTVRGTCDFTQDQGKERRFVWWWWWRWICRLDNKDVSIYGMQSFLCLTWQYCIHYEYLLSSPKSSTLATCLFEFWIWNRIVYHHGHIAPHSVYLSSAQLRNHVILSQSLVIMSCLCISFHRRNFLLD